MRETALFFLAVVIPDPWSAEIRTFQKIVAEQFDSKAALRSPPHITLVPPFQMRLEELQRLYEVLQSDTTETMPLNIELNGFARFDRRVIYVHVEPSLALAKFAAILNRLLIANGFRVKEEHRAYHPHVTIAFKDLRADQFKLAWKHFGEIPYAAAFEAPAFSLLQHTGQKWIVLNAFPLYKDHRGSSDV